MLVLAVLRELLAHDIPPHMLPSAQSEHMPHQFVTASLHCALTTTQFLVLPIYIYFPRGVPDVPGGCIAHSTLPQVRLLAAKVRGTILTGLWEQCCQQSLVLCPTVPSPAWAGGPRSQGLQGRAKPIHLTALLCAEPSPSPQLHSSLRSVSQGGAGTLRASGRQGKNHSAHGAECLHPVGAPRRDEPSSHQAPFIH